MVEYSGDGAWPVSASYDKAVCIWDVSSGTVLHVLSGHRGGLLEAPVNADASRVMTEHRVHRIHGTCIVASAY
jgi:WD40 repeat protein